MSNEFDVFLAHNSQDKAIVRNIANELRQRNIDPWLDDEQIPAGQPILDFIEKAIQNVKSIAVFIGLKKLGSWQKIELLSLIGVAEDIPIIPVLLPGVDDIPNNLTVFLKNYEQELEEVIFRYIQKLKEVDFRESEPDPIMRLCGGIKYIREK